MIVENDWLLTSAKAAIHLPTATAVLADLHLGYAETRRRGGDAIPTLSVEQLLAPLRSLVATHDVHRLVIAGDLLESAQGVSVVEQFLEWLKEVRVELTDVVLGNHDRGLSRLKKRLPIRDAPVVLGDWQIVHGDGVIPKGPVVQGHLHPCLRWGIHTTVPCYLTGHQHLILPAYSPEAAGVNVLRQQRWKGYRCRPIVGEGVLDLGEVERLRLGNHC